VAMSLPPSGTLAASDKTILSGVDIGCSPVAVTATRVRVSRRKESVAALVVPSFLTAGLFCRVAKAGTSGVRGERQLWDGPAAGKKQVPERRRMQPVSHLVLGCREGVDTGAVDEDPGATVLGVRQGAQQGPVRG
jgi:hypothetical protein